ncbi:Replication protein [Lacticaseibacillus paracasei]|nr:Replication protein [Lacticaseibacillus paracasei]
MVDPAEPIFEMDRIATQFILIFYLEKNVHVLTVLVQSLLRESASCIMN